MDGMKRRAFLLSLPAAAAASAASYAPKLSVQTYVWTQEFSERNITLLDGLDQLFGDTKAAGYRRIELMPAFFTKEARPRTEALLRQTGLELPIVYSGARLYDESAVSAIATVIALADIVKPLGCRILNVNPDPKPGQASKTDAELVTQAAAVERLRTELEKREMRLILHHHSPEMQDEGREWNHLLQNTKAGICLDIDWIHQGGQDPLKLMAAAGNRLASLHIRNATNGIGTQSLDEGGYDYAAVRDQLKRMGFDGYLVVELAWNPKTARTRTLKQNLERSRVWAETTFGL
jgi:inosose dehydratase